MSLQYTEQQAKAILTRGVSIALDAGAGCGKTFVLTERFLSHLAPGDEALELHELAAITFTEAAAREMRERVRAKCLDRLRSADEQQAGHWLRLLRSIDGARVSTIHAFCSTLVKNYALELGLDPGFYVLDQAAADVLTSEAIDRRLRLMLQARDADVMSLAAQYGLAGLKGRLGALRDAASGGLRAWAGRSPEQIVAAWQEYFRERVRPLELQQLADAEEIDQVLSYLPESTGDEQTRAKLAQLGRLLSALQSGERDVNLAEVRALAMVRGVCGKKTDWPSADLKDKYSDAVKRLRGRIDKLTDWRADNWQTEAAALGLRLGKIASAVVEEYGAAKRAAGALDFDDLLAQARRLLTDEAFADVQRRVERSTRLLLVDEFQDTDQAQVDIVKAITGPQLQTGGLFFVGDFKQSIYRFRGAEPKVFGDLQGETPAEGRLPLSQNFRSQPAVLEFVNALFGRLFDKNYVPLQPARPQLGPRPAAQLLWSQAPEDADAEAGRIAEARRIARHVAELLSDSTPRVACRQGGQWAARPVRPGDIAILFRALGDVQHYEQALRDAGIDHHLIGGHAFYSQQEVYDLLNLLRSVTSTCDEVSLAGVLRSPFFSLTDESLLWLRQAGGSLNAGLLQARPIKQLSKQQRQRVDHARAVLTELRQLKGAVATAEIIRVALDRTGYDAALLAEYLGERKLANLEKVIEQARAADLTRPGDVDGFVRQLTEFIARQPKEANAATTDEDADVVRLMTVHHSKGLEFPVVIVADLNRKSRGDASVAAFDPSLGPLVRPAGLDSKIKVGLDLWKKVQRHDDLEELTRLFYVACTRAADLLVLSAAVEDIEQPKGEWLRNLGAVINLQTGADRDSGEVIAEVVAMGDQRPAEPLRTQRPDLPKLIKQAMRSRAAGADNAAAPIAVRPEDLQRFSVSRLSGRFRHASDYAIAEAEGRDDSEPIDPRGLGTLVHAVMERTDFRSVSDAQWWCRRLAPQHLRRNWNAAGEEAAKLVEQFLAGDRAAQLAEASTVNREVEFAMPWPPAGAASASPPAVLQGYIDCLYKDSSGDWRVLDYKTNRVTAEDAAAAAEQYRLQLSVYALAVEAAFGVAPVGLDLHFLRPGCEVAFPWDAAARRGAIEAIDQAIQKAREWAVENA